LRGPTFKGKEGREGRRRNGPKGRRRKREKGGDSLARPLAQGLYYCSSTKNVQFQF